MLCVLAAPPPLLPGELAAGTLPLNAAIEWALENHPALEAGEAAVASRQGATQQASYRPNPIFSFQSENWRAWGSPALSPARDLDVFFFVTQRVETAGKRSKRVAEGEASEELARRQREMLRWQIRQQVKQAYWRALAAREQVRLIEEQRETARQLTEYNEIRVRLGAAAEVEAIKVRLEAQRVEMRLAAARMDQDQARIGVLQAMGASNPALAVEIPNEPPPAGLDQDLDREAVVAIALANRAEVRRARAAVEAAQAALASQRAIAKPDLLPYFGYKRAGRFNTVVGGVSVALTAFDRNQGAIRSAVAEVRRREAELAAAENRVRAEVTAATEALRRRQQMVREIRGGMMDRAGDTAQIALAAYREGGAELLEVLDAQRTLNEVRLMYAQAGYDHILSWIALETAVGSESIPTHPDTQRAAADAATALRATR